MPQVATELILEFPAPDALAPCAITYTGHTLVALHRLAGVTAWPNTVSRADSSADSAFHMKKCTLLTPGPRKFSFYAQMASLQGQCVRPVRPEDALEHHHLSCRKVVAYPEDLLSGP